MAAPPLASAARLLGHLRRQPYDLRLEVILAELLAYGYQLDDFLVRPVGLFARRYRRDVGQVSEEEFERHHHPVRRLALEVHREGLYDALPQQVFHPPGPADGEHPPGVPAMVADSRAQRRREKAARQFFLPFEQEFLRCRVRLEQEERRYFTSYSARWYNEALARFWGLADAGLPPAALTNLLYVLPLAASVAGDLARTRQCFESVLDQPVQLQLVAPLRHALPTAGGSAPGAGTLGHLSLGRDLVLGGDYLETLPALEVSVGQLTVAGLTQYLAGGWQARALELLCAYLLPFETDVVLRYELARAAPEFRLGEGEEAPVLGFTTAGI